MKPYNRHQSKRDQVRRMFDGIAPRYDMLNHILSMGVDRRWRRRAVKEVCAAGPQKVLDVATGTGDIAIAVTKKLPGAQVCGVDLSPQMVAVGEGKIKKAGLAGRISLRVGDVSAMDFPDGEFDAVCVAFGVRNFEDIGGGLKEMCRVIKPGGRVAILEFSIPRGKIFSAAYRFYFHRVLPRIGGMVSGDGKAYDYLPSSVEEFPAPDEFLKMMVSTGFTNCRARSLTGGIAYIYTGEKP